MPIFKIRENLVQIWASSNYFMLKFTWIIGRIFGRIIRSSWPNIRYRPIPIFAVSVVHYIQALQWWVLKKALFFKVLSAAENTMFLCENEKAVGSFV